MLHIIKDCADYNKGLRMHITNYNNGSRKYLSRSSLVSEGLFLFPTSSTVVPSKNTMLWPGRSVTLREDIVVGEKNGVIRLGLCLLLVRKMA